jgi:hypothetical protein
VFKLTLTASCGWALARCFLAGILFVDFEITVEKFHITTMPTTNDYITYNAQYKVLICRQHKYGISPDGILTIITGGNDASFPEFVW